MILVNLNRVVSFSRVAVCSRLSMCRYYSGDPAEGPTMKTLAKNHYSKNFVLRMGNEMACAKWLVSNGAWIRWRGETEFIKTIDELDAVDAIKKTFDDESGRKRRPTQRVFRRGRVKVTDPKATDENKAPVNFLGLPIPMNDKVLEEIFADEAELTPRGFNYFIGVKGVKKMILLHTNLLDDSAIEKLVECEGVSKSLEHLELIANDHITDTTMGHIQGFENLKFLRLLDLPSVYNGERGVRILRCCLPNCQIEYNMLGPNEAD